MKELSVEEKAKRYDDVVSKLGRFMAQGVGPLITRADVQNFFPELQESNDERIRKALIKYFSEGVEYLSLIPYNKEQCVAWLEKQGEPVDKVEHKFKVDDEIKTANEEPLTITKIDEKGYWSEDLFICGFDEECIWDLVEQEPAAWSEEDEKTFSLVLKNLYMLLDNAKGCSPDWVFYLTNAIQFIKSLKDKVQPQPKQEWTEEDEKMYAATIFALAGFMGNEDKIDWLKSLKERYIWKPSEEQMRVLDLAIRCGINRGTTEETTLVSLFNDLKELKA